MASAFGVKIRNPMHCLVIGTETITVADSNPVNIQSAIPYSENFHTGTPGESKSISFKVTDDNGSTQATSFAEFNVFPNPVTEYATIEIDGEPNAPISVEIVDEFGNSIKRIDESLNDFGWLVRTLDVENLGSGTYYFTIKMNKETYTKRIMIE